MHKVLVIGAGKIGSLISFLLAHSNDYYVNLADIQENNPHVKTLGKLPHFKYSQLDANDSNHIAAFIKQHKIEAIISSLSYYANLPIAKIAAEYNLHYFDLTEDVETTKAVDKLAKHAKSVFIPQCGLAPGFISIVANDLMTHFPTLDTVKMRVGALPTNVRMPCNIPPSTDG